MLKFMTCGAVDNGKSTLLGRILSDSQVIMKDQVVSDLAHIFDGLEEERAQNMTIDVAYGYFRTKKKRFILADAPGHIEFLSNMVTAASQIDIALLLIDSVQGISAQTCKHAEILDFMNVSTVIICINKMDLVNFSKARFEELQRQFECFSFNFKKIYIPIVARNGDNVVYKASMMSWFDNEPLLKILENHLIDPNKKQYPWSVQWQEGNTCYGLSHNFKAGERVFTKYGECRIESTKNDDEITLTHALQRGDIVSRSKLRLFTQFRVTILGFQIICKQKNYLIQFQHKTINGFFDHITLKNNFQKTVIYLEEGMPVQDYALIIHPETFETMGVMRIEPSIFWFTGRSAAGKSTLARALNKEIPSSIVLDADEIRETLNDSLTLSFEDRVKNIKRISEMAYLLAKEGNLVLVACIAPFHSQREFLKSNLPLAEIFVNTPLEVCQKRDPKCLYKKGIGSFANPSPYEEPTAPDLCISTDSSLEECVSKLLHFINL